MGFQEKKNAERILFKELRDKSSYVDRKNVKINDDLFIDDFNVLIVEATVIAFFAKVVSPVLM